MFVVAELELVYNIIIANDNIHDSVSGVGQVYVRNNISGMEQSSPLVLEWRMVLA